MINQSKYIYHLGKKKKRKKINKIVILLIICFCVAILSFFFIPFNRIFTFISGETNKTDIEVLWKNKRYNDIITEYMEKLERKPLNPIILTYLGFSYFFKAKSTTYDKDMLIDKAILLLRKAKLIPVTNLAGEIDYVLGLAYFLKGKYFYDLSIKYMESSIMNNYKGVDTNWCLGMAYGGMGNFDKELEYYLKAAKEKESSLSLLSVGEVYIKKGNFQLAENYLMRALNKANDNNIEQQCRFRLGEIYFERNDYLKAEEQYKNILKINKKSANAHFYLGEIYAKLNNIIEARAEWRKALIIDPSHYGAKLRYYN